jgi:hypothetical protein
MEGNNILARFHCLGCSSISLIRRRHRWRLLCIVDIIGLVVFGIRHFSACHIRSLCCLDLLLYLSKLLFDQIFFVCRETQVFYPEDFFFIDGIFSD